MMMMMVMTAGPESNVRSSGLIQKFALGGRDFSRLLSRCLRVLTRCCLPIPLSTSVFTFLFHFFHFLLVGRLSWQLLSAC